MYKCPACRKKTEVVRSMTGKGIQTDYICRKCNIAWYVDDERKWKIRLSSTNTLASKLDEKEFNKMIEIIKKHS